MSEKNLVMSKQRLSTRVAVFVINGLLALAAGSTAHAQVGRKIEE